MAQGDKLRIIQTTNFGDSNVDKTQFKNNAVIFDTSGGIWLGQGDPNSTSNETPVLIAGGVSLGTSNGEVDGVDLDNVCVKFVPQTLTDAQKAQARTNIGIDGNLDGIGGTTMEYV